MKAVEKGTKFTGLSCWYCRVSILVLALFLFSSGGIRAQVPSYVPKGGLVGWWPFNGNTNDESGNGRNGTNNGAISTSDRFGKTNSALKFNGAQNVALSNIQFQNYISTGFTLSYWFTYDDISTVSGSVFSNYDGVNGLQIDLEYNGGTKNPQLRHSLRTNSRNPPEINYHKQFPNVASNWNHAVMVWAPPFMKTYFNGELVDSTNGSGLNSFSVCCGVLTRIGSRWNGQNAFKGKIDDVAIWNRPLSNLESIQLYKIDKDDCTFTKVSISGRVNSNPSSPSFSGISDVANMPDGHQIYNGIPFTIIPWSVARNAWNAEHASGPNPRKLVLNSSGKNIKGVHLLANTYWGLLTSNSYADVEFWKNGSVFFRKKLIGNVDIRDFNENGGSWTQFINNTTTVNAWSWNNGSRRIDNIGIYLPLSNRIDSIVVNDFGNSVLQRVFILAATLVDACDCTIDSFNPLPDKIYSLTDSVILNAGSGFSRFRWSSGDTTQTLNVKYTGGYRVTVTNASGCTASDSIFVQFPDTVGLHVSTVNGLCNKQVDVPVRATAFRHMLTMQGSVNWNAVDLRLDSISGYGPASMGMDVANFGLSQAGNGRITFSWNDPSGNGLSLADSTTVFTLRFTPLGTTIRSVPVTITSTPTPLEFFDAGLVKKSSVQTVGGVNITCEFTISGKVLTPLDQGLRNVTVTLTGGASPLTAKTDSAGNYSFKILPGTYTLTPVKGNEQNKTNGISTLDIALIQAHILQKTPFNASYKVIAGDANNSQGVTTGDILFLRKLILGTDTTLPGNRLWALVDGGQTFANPLVPFPFSSTKTFTNQSTDVSHTFRGIKIGDVNYDRNPLLDQAPSGDTLRLFGEWIDTEDGYVTLKVKSRAVSGLLGWQSTLRWDAKQLQLYKTTGLINNLGIGERWKDEGYLTLSWNDPRAEGLSFTEGSTWMELRFRKTSALQRTGIGMTEEKLGTEAFNDNYQSMGVKMEPVELRGNAWNGVLRVYPNPADRLVNVEWKSLRNGSGQIRLVDAQGRVVYQREASVVQGLNKARIEVPVGLSSGSFVVQVHMGGDVNTASVLIGK